MKKIKQLFSMIIRIFLTFKYTCFPSINNSDAEYLIWAPDFISLRFLYGDNLQKVMFTYYYLIKNGRSPTIWLKSDIGRFHSKNIIYFGSHKYNKFKFSNYMDSLVFITNNLELQDNNVFPNSNEVLLWENKAWMHKKFDSLGIRTPKTLILKLDSRFPDINNFDYPLLVKEEHSCSAIGVHKIKSIDDLTLLVNSTEFRNNNKNLIVQELLNMRRDLRVIIVGGEIILHYWRINLSQDWKPTSTGHGSQVDFEFFPELWRDWILDAFKKLEVRTGAFDIAWQNDDLNTEPYILEISTFYQPNPKPNNEEDLKNYGDWKNSVRILNSYQAGVVNVIGNVQEYLVKELIRKN